MTLSESIGRYAVRKTLRFEMKPVGKTADYLDGLIAADEERASSLNLAKAAIEAEHLAMVRRVFKALPDPIPKPDAIRRAFMADPEYNILVGRNANIVLNTIIERCHYNRWAVPKQLKDLGGWQPLFIKWHWHCVERDKLARAWAGRSKEEVEDTSRILRTPKKLKPSRNFWFDRGPFRMMFDNHSCGMSWLRDDFRISRTFLLKDGERILIGVVPRSSPFNPHSLTWPRPRGKTYLLYEETAGEKPKLSPIPSASIDVPAERGTVYLFELTGRGLRNRTNLNAQYLRALLSEENLRDPVFHLDKVCEFFARKATDMGEGGLPGHFRMRFAESKFFVSLHVTCNPQFAGNDTRPQPFASLVDFVGANPFAKFIRVVPAQGGYDVESETSKSSVSTCDARSGKLSGLLAKMVVENDAVVVFRDDVPEAIRRAVKVKFDYIVVRGRAPFDEGGVMRGYQLADRLFVGGVGEAEAAAKDKREEAERKRALREAEEAERAKRAADKEARRLHAEEVQREAARRRALREQAMKQGDCELFKLPVFQVGRFLFKFGYKTSDNQRHQGTCRADERDDVYRKLREIGIRPFCVECDDPDYAARKGAPAAAELTIAERLKRINGLKEQGLLTDEEYAAQRTKILSEL